MLIIPLWSITSLCFIVLVMTVLAKTPDTIDHQAQGQAQVLGVQDHSAYSLYSAIPPRSNQLTQAIKYSDTRAIKLHGFLNYYGAPIGMIEAIPEFLNAADAFDLPWTLLPAIACKESGCGRIVPVNSYNPFGWAVYTGQQSGANFSSFAHAVQVVAEGLRKDYFDRGLDTLPEIESRYTPISSRTHQGWQRHVDFFMQQLEDWALEG